MSTPVSDLPIAEQLQVAEHKMQARPVQVFGERVPIYDANYFKSMLRLYGDTARALKVAPNYTASADECGFPHGFELHCSPRAPVWAMPFEGRALAAGVAAFPVSVGAQGERSDQLDVARLIANRDQIHRAMLATLDNDTVLGGEGDPCAFAGIYWQYTEQRRPTFWAVARAHSPAESSALMNCVRDAEPESLAQVSDYVRERIERHSRFQAALSTRARAERGEIDADALSRDEELRELAAGVGDDVASKRELTVPYVTWDQFFFRTSEVTRKVEAQRVHRARAVALVLRAAGITSDTRINSLDEQTSAIVQSTAALDATINWADQVDSNDANSSIVFMSNLTSSLSQRNNSGVVLQNAPHRDLHIVRAPFVSVHEAVGLPVSTGPRYISPERIEEIHTEDEQGEAVDSVPPLECVYAPRSENDATHPVFSSLNWRDAAPNLWRSAGKTFVAPKSRNATTSLRAIAVRLADPLKN